jgi:endonuclease YncB( thermonuclease family)
LKSLRPCCKDSPRLSVTLRKRRKVELRRTLGCVHSSAQDQQSAIVATGAALEAFSPQDEIEGMIAAQALAAHHAALNCWHRAMLPNQPPDIAARLRRDAANMARTMTDMVDALARKRGQVSTQVMRIEKVVIEPGSQAMLGNVKGG